MQGQYNMRSPAVKRLMKEAQELRDPTELYFAQPLEDNLFEWHFTLRGPEGSDFDGGIYHGRIVLPAEYPMKPPSIIMLTPNGRFETNKKICLSISGHHPESWQPSWSIRTALLAIIGFMPTHGGGAIGSLDYTPEERKVLAKKSQDWKCQDCGELSSHLKPVTEASEKASQEARELATQINFQEEKQANLESKNRAGIQTAPETTASANAPPNSLPAFPWSQAPGWPTLPTAGNIGSGAYIRFPYPPLFMYPAPSVNRPEGNLPPRMAFFPPMPFIPPTYGGTSPIALPAQQPTSPETSPACASSGAVEASSILPETVGGDGSKTVPTVKECCPETSDIAEKECLRTTSSASTISPSEVVTADSVSHNNAALCIEETVHSLSGSPEAAAPFECVAPVTADSFTNVISASGSASDISSSGSETSTATTIAAPVLTESTNLRLRHTQNVAAAQITTDIGGAGAAPLTGNRAPPQQESGMTYVVMMIMLIVAISLLLVRRILQCFTSDVHAVFKS